MGSETGESAPDVSTQKPQQTSDVPASIAEPRRPKDPKELIITKDQLRLMRRFALDTSDEPALVFRP